MARGRNPYKEKDAARDTKSSVSHVKGAWHQAKDDAAKAGNWRVPKDRHASVNNTRSNRRGKNR